MNEQVTNSALTLTVLVYSISWLGVILATILWNGRVRKIWKVLASVAFVVTLGLAWIFISGIVGGML